MLTHISTLTFAALVAFGPANLADLDPSPARAHVDSDRRKAACDGAEGWIGDGEDGRGPPACDGPDGDETDLAGLREPDWGLRGDDAEDDEPPAWP